MWLIKHDVAQAMQRAVKAGIAPTAAQCAEFVARQQEAEALNGIPRNLKLAGDVAQICIEGVLTPKPDFFALWFGSGNTTYESIRSAIALVEADPAIKEVQFKISSPGGQVEGLFETLASIGAMTKKRYATASMADSAAYAIASTVGNIEAVNVASEFGSIGVAVTCLNIEELIDITSTEAPNKRPDPTTDEGQAVIRQYLDSIHDVFVDAIATGRGTTTEDVNKNYGRGSVLLAGDAKKRKMIDKIAKPALRAVTVDTEANAPPKTIEPSPIEPQASSGHDELVAVGPDTSERPKQLGADAGVGPQKKRTTMNEEELRAQHPELYAVLIAKGEKQGTTNERDRVCAHLTLGQQSGDMKTAIGAIESGDGMTQTLTAKYLAAGMNRADRSTRQAESDAAAATVAGATSTAATGATAATGVEAEGAAVADALERLRGKKVVNG